MGKKILITGAAGYIGSLLVDKLVKKGYEVVGYVRDEEKAKTLTAKGASYILGDIKELDKLEKAARESDAVIHLAFDSKGIRDMAGFVAACKLDRDAYEALARALKGTNKTLIGTGGTGLYGDTKDRVIDDSEDVPLSTPRADAEYFLLKQAENGIRAIMIRIPPFVYGYAGHGFFAQMIAAAKKGGEAIYIGDGSGCTTVVHVEDASDIYVAALEKGVSGVAYNAVGQNDVSFKRFAEAIGKLLKVPTKSITPQEAQEIFGVAAMLFVNNSRASAGRAAKDLGWKPNPKWDVEEDLTVGSYTKMV